MHSDCFELFIQECILDQALDRLWIAIAWKNPWRKAPDLHLHYKTNIASSSLQVAEKYCKLPLRSLPPELVQMIQNYSESSLFWRYISAVGFSYQLSTTTSNSLESVPLCQLSAWQRGGRPIVAEASAGHIIRLTIDSYGIRELEKLLESPPYNGSRFDNVAFIIQKESCLSGVIAKFKHGLLRLELPEARAGLQIWDTPTPPDLEHCTFCPANITASTRFHTINLRKTTGITFFFCHGEVYAIHAHTPTLPYAKKTLEHLSSRRQRSVIWVYIPISPSDQVAAFGVQLKRSIGHFVTGQPRFLFRMRLAGDISVGPYHSGATQDFILSNSPPMTLIYNAADLQPISVIGAYPKHESRPIAPFRHPAPDEPPFRDAYFSSAPLEKVTRVQVFYGEENTYCRGILFKYENGAQQAVGQCRLGIDPHKTCVKPSSFCFTYESYYRPRTEVRLQTVKVEFTCEAEHNYDKDHWTCFTMSGMLRFWFTDEESRLNVTID
ncbi:hypothetical protein B7463_g11741, partial [Scytalidium lignicola]